MLIEIAGEKEKASVEKWDARFIDLARHIAQWSKDPSSKCGAVITDGKRIVSVGFNGFAAGTDDSPERYADREYKYATVIHCEENAIIQARQSLEHCYMYLTGMSCGSCTARVIQAGIQMVVIPAAEEDAFFHREDSTWFTQFEFAKRQMEAAGVYLKVLDPTGYDPSNLMGPEHPYMKKIETAKSDAIQRLPR